MASQLSQYNGALSFIGSGERIVRLNEDREERYAFDAVFDETVAFVLAEAPWKFALRTETISANTDLTVRPGFDYAFDLPEDNCRIVVISDVAVPPDQVVDFETFSVEGPYIYANIDTLYLTYVSKDGYYGGDLALWPEPFALAHQAWLAFKSTLPLTSDRSNRNDLLQIYRTLRKQAETQDALQAPVRRTPPGRFVRSRFAGRLFNREQGRY